MSHHFNSFLMNDVLIKLEEQSFFADIGEERTLRFVQDALTLSVHHDGNPGEALAGVGQRLGMCYYCWDRGTDLRQGICSDCRAADSIGIDSEDAETSPPRKAAVSYGFISPETIRDLLGFLPEKLTRDLDVRNVQELPGNCIDRHLREIRVDAAWRVDYLPGKRQRSGTPVLMIELLSHPYPRVAQRLRRYASMLSDCLRGSRSVGKQAPSIVPVLVYNGAPAWTPRSSTEGCNAFEYTFIDVGRLRPDETKSHEPVAALSSPKTAADRNRRYWESPTATLICTGHATILPAEAPKDHHGERAADHAT